MYCLLYTGRQKTIRLEVGYGRYVYQTLGRTVKVGLIKEDNIAPLIALNYLAIRGKGAALISRCNVLAERYSASVWLQSGLLQQNAKVVFAV